MSALIRFFTKILDICRLVPMLPVVVIAAIPLALLGDWHPWGHAADIAMLGDPGFGQWLIIALVLIIVADTVRGMIDDLRHGQVGVDLLAVVAILSTVAVHEYWASWAVMLMVTSGEAIEEYAQAKAEHSLTALMEAAPRTAHVVSLPGVGRDSAGDAGDASEGFRRVGQFATASAAHRFDTVPVEQVRLGDVLMVLPGETVPVDGELLSGSATLDLSDINGEPVPREVFAGARVMSGAVNGSTALTMRATQVAADSQYQRILELVASAQESRPAVVKTADRLAVPFTVLSLVIAGVAWAVSGVPTRFAQVLVLATPCPLLIAAPVAYIAGTGRLAAAGVLIKAQDVLENLGRVTQVFFDKTGTLTVKQPQVVRVEMLPGAATQFDGDHVLMMAGVVESYSVHILSKGIAKAGTEAMARLRRQSENDGRPCPESDAVWFGVGREHPVVKGINEEAGKGVSGEVNGHVVRVGRLSFAAAGKDGFLTAGNADPTGPRHDPRPGTEAAGGTEEDVRTRFGLLQPDEMASYVSIDGRLIARIVLRDVPRANAGTALAKLHALGVARLAMLTGDKRASADIIANEVGIDEVHAELFPEDKVAAVKSAAEDGNAVTMMVGDGVNDAPVLAVADIGVAMTDGTSTAASESAQVVIMTDDIAAVPRAIAIARRTKRVMLQAVIVGLALAVIGMIAAAFDLIPVVVGAFLQEAIDVVSILWGLTALIDRD
ncbi:heavy metal translocating P-type ATPase [Bifidobacterium longum]|uniref:Cadmium, zinc and cobalt-transporting ATPase n=4 Tax=Bifidobacterium longum TaxID=216816 RepID=A0ABP1X908_BIFLI|nr:heavy metal translocating P-type ATPase [Bifidobacterium longum]ACJ51232.1 heavy metal translocating P-type ATPase [Bifidobacterium longum subsp. infantis ATCC 15697 = JCM 1222 = DSM 20088]MBX4250553.1 heavy metal translocating P-type ATPase [Bifidobacterium longum subsp. infantis]MEE4090214.1 heavy metal translocating P-type ATPase [Bifidobacterium longum subsp. infantis]CEE96256.1 Cadmium, zinc and cobalt-transporting ATPase [Bifidobacterium longum subsp. infantis]CEE97185.1 Cadmium, zinc